MLATVLNMIYYQWSQTALGYEAQLGPEVNWALVSVLGMTSHCDGAFVKYSVEKRMTATSESTCGGPCRDLEALIAPTSVQFAQSKVDSTQYIMFTTNISAKIGSSGSDVTTSNFVAFRGTTSVDVINIRRNLVFKFMMTTMCPSCEIHQGFWRNYLALRPSLMTDISKVKELALAGNSMGAPLATLGGYQACLLGKAVVGVMTTGMPRVANAAFAKQVFTKINSGIQTVGFAYGRDPVAHVPPRFFGYKGTQAKLFHIKIIIELDAFDQNAQKINNIRFQDTDYGQYVHYSKVYLNSASSFDGDKEFAASVSTYNIDDHLKYWKYIGGSACGMASDSLLKMTTAAELFFL